MQIKYDGISTQKNTRFSFFCLEKTILCQLFRFAVNQSFINRRKRCFKYFLLKKKCWIPSDTKKGGWKAIADSTVKSYKVGDSATTITNRTRLLLPMIYHEILKVDAELAEGILKFKKRSNLLNKRYQNTSNTWMFPLLHALKHHDQHGTLPMDFEWHHEI
jgi:hypothetical protein